MKRLTVLSLGFVLMFVAVQGAMASTASGPALEGSVDQDAYEDGWNGSAFVAFDQIVIWSADPIMGPEGIRNFGDSSWSVVCSDQFVTVAKGNEHSGVNLNYQMHFLSDYGIPFVAYYAIFDNGVQLTTQKLPWTGSGWGTWEYLPELITPPSCTPPVPEPVTMASAFLAISGLGVYLRRRTK